MKTSAAFTFVEVLAAMAFLGILIPVIVKALTISNRAGVVAERSGIAAQLGENRLGELMVGDAWTTAEAGGDFGQEWPGYRWEIQQAAWSAGDMTELTLLVFYPVQGVERSLALSTLVSETLSQK